MISVSGFFLTIILLGAIQGIIVGFLLFYSREYRRSNRLLAVLLWLMSMASLNLYLENTGLFYYNSIIALFHAFVPILLVMAIGPLIYFYICSSLDPSFRIGKKQRLHFLPVILDFVPSLIAVYFFTGTYGGWLVPDPEPWGIFIDQYNMYADIPRWLSITIYVIKAAKWLSNYKKEQVDIPQPSRLKWLQQFIRIFIIFQFIWFIYLIPYVIPKYSNWLLDHVGWYPIYIPLVILIYWLGIKGYLVSQTAAAEKIKRPAELPQELINTITAALGRVMEQEKRYLDPSFNLAALARDTKVPSKTLSIFLNQYLQKSFHEYLNGFRVAAFKEKVHEPGLEHLTINGIASECGFNSQASFQRIFKQMTGMSPSEFRRSGPSSVK
jgi:AraC-like DNA-binding protein